MMSLEPLNAILLKRLEDMLVAKDECISWLVYWFSVNRTSGGWLKWTDLVVWSVDVARGVFAGPLLQPPAWHLAA